jgi:hypothetical protein
LPNGWSAATAFAQLMFLGFIEAELAGMAALPEGEFPEALADFRGRVAVAKSVIQQLAIR